jgi:hypothetical protein
VPSGALLPRSGGPAEWSQRYTCSAILPAGNRRVALATHCVFDRMGRHLIQMNQNDRSRQMMLTTGFRKFTWLLVPTALVVSAAGAIGATAFAASLKNHASDGQAVNGSALGWDSGPTILSARQGPTQHGPVYLFRPDALLTNGLSPNPPTYG